MNTVDVRTLTRFSDDDEATAAVLAQSTLRRLEKGETLFWEGDEPCCLVFVVNGSLKLTHHLDNGREVIVDVLCRGEAADEAAVWAGLPHSVTVTAHEEATVLVLDRERYLTWIAADERRRRDHAKELGRQMNRLSRRLAELAAGSARSRIAYLLFTLYQRFGRVEGEQMRLDIPLSRQEVADMIGTCLTTAIRTMSRLEKHGIVKAGAHGVRVFKPECLRLVADRNCDCETNPCAAF